MHQKQDTSAELRKYVHRFRDESFKRKEAPTTRTKSTLGEADAAFGGSSRN